MTFKTKKELEDYLKKQAVKALEEMAQKVHDLWHNLIQTKFYNAYEPTSYARTYQLLDSLNISQIKPSGNGYVIEIFMDESKVTDRNGSHYRDSVSEVFMYATEGVHGNFQTEDRFYEDIQNWVHSGEAKKEFQAILTQNGLKGTFK